MTILLRVARASTEPVPPRIGDLVHLWVRDRPEGRRCAAAIVTRVLSGDRLQLHEMVDRAGVTAAPYPSGGWQHASDAPDAPSSWHRRDECPDGR